MVRDSLYPVTTCSAFFCLSFVSSFERSSAPHCTGAAGGGGGGHSAALQFSYKFDTKSALIFMNFPNWTYSKGRFLFPNSFLELTLRTPLDCLRALKVERHGVWRRLRSPLLLLSKCRLLRLSSLPIPLPTSRATSSTFRRTRSNTICGSSSSASSPRSWRPSGSGTHLMLDAHRQNTHEMRTVIHCRPSFVHALAHLCLRPTRLSPLIPSFAHALLSQRERRGQCVRHLCGLQGAHDAAGVLHRRRHGVRRRLLHGRRGCQDHPRLARQCQ